jgi:ribokinase
MPQQNQERFRGTPRMVEAQQQHPLIVIVGSYATGLVMRTAHIPVPGETVLATNFQTLDGGKGSNQAAACARLGAHATFVAAIGQDSNADRALSLLTGEGVDTSHVRRVADLPTGAGFITVDDKGNNAICVYLGANRALSCKDIDGVEDVIARADVVLAQLEIPVATALYAMSVARRHGVLTILNPAPAQPLPAKGLANVDILTPNLVEAQVLSGLETTDCRALGEALHRSGAGNVVITLGDHGAQIAGEHGLIGVPTYRVAAVDSTGAGDAFSAALAVALAVKMTLRDAVAFACASGAYSVRSLGTIPSYATRVQLELFIDQASVADTRGDQQ